MTNDNQSNLTGSDQTHSQETLTLNGQGLKNLIEAGLAWLKTNQQTVNSLNVFPVPDGDTGTNMLLTMQAAYNEISKSGDTGVGKMAHAIAQGALMGARGNSGVILSQLWRGFARALDNLETMDAQLLSRALTEAKNTAYKGVVRPVEGTILTVAKDVAASAEKNVHDTSDLKKILEEIVRAADLSVQHTPELLPILKQAGVVDSGGKGLFFILEGMLRSIKGQPLDTAVQSVQPLSALNLDNTMEDIEPGQDYEVVIDFKPFKELNLDLFYQELSDIGTSIQIGEGDGMYRMHIHVPEEKRNTPDEYIRNLGTVIKETRENLRAQMEAIEKAEDSHQSPHIEPGQIAIIAVSPGKGISRIFASLGATAIVAGGQTMNPSTEEILKAFENLPTEKILILPNNKNIILAAQTAASMTVKKVHVIPSSSVPQGLSAMLRYDPDGDFNQLNSEMVQALKDVDTGEITVATRSIEINGVDVEEGQVIALLNGKLIYSSSSLEDACIGLLEKADTQDKERITLFYGNNISRNDVNQIVDKIRSAYPSHEIELHEGGQPHYQFILSIE
jgi:uncharacterized protein